MALSASARARKCQLKKKGMKPNQINNYLLTHGFIEPIEKNRPKHTKAKQKENLKPASKYVQEIMNIQSHFKDNDLQCSVDNAIKLYDRMNQFDDHNTDTPSWTRPKIHHPVQNKVIDAILYSNKHVFMIDGSKRRGKSSTIFSTFCEAQYNNKGLKRWFLYGATEDNAAKILRSVVEDPLFYPYTSPIMKGTGSAMKQIAYNGGRIEVMASGSERRTSGTDADVIWVDESHSVLIENPKTIAMSAMVLLARKDMKIIYTMNREGEAYEYFKNEMLNSYPADDIAYFSFVEENCPHIDKEQDTRVRAIVKASAGEDYAAQYLDNAYVRQHGLYYPLAKISEAYKEHESPKLEQYDMIACGVDWGDNHDTALFVGGLFEDKVFEEEMVYLQHPSASEIVRVLTRFIRDYPGIIFIWEGSPLGAFARNEVRSRFPNQRFIDSNFSKYKQNYIDNLYIYLVDEDIYLKDGKLKRQLRSYVNDKKNDDGHDALAHFLFKITKPRTQMKQHISVIERS